jgi:hypothetical protein
LIHRSHVWQVYFGAINSMSPKGTKVFAATVS